MVKAEDIDIRVPNLEFMDALKFCVKLREYEWKECNILDFAKVKNCDPFTMLIVAHKILSLRNKHPETTCRAINCNNTYAENMRFYRLIGIAKGAEINREQGNKNYQAITELDFTKMYDECRKTGKQLGEVVTNTSQKLASVIARGDEKLKKTMTFCLREILRNIPEHSGSCKGWYCAQFWPKYDLVELAIMDNGCGIYKSITNNIRYAMEGLDNEKALKMALQPGISERFDDSGNEEIFAGEANKWKNSGYGLYVVSKICAKLGANFVLASGNKAIYVTENSNIISHEIFDTDVDGTAIRIRLRPSKIDKIEQILKEIREEDTKKVASGYNTPSRASFPQF